MTSFETLVECMAAIVQNDSDALRAALAGARPDRVVAMSVRHKCHGILLHGILAIEERDPAFRPVLELLKPFGKTAALQNYTVAAQLQELVAILNDAGVNHVLLKTGARLYAGEAIGMWTTFGDLDVMIRREQADAALAALGAIGYRAEYEERSEYYRRFHHHLAPLVPAGIGKPVELHLALALAGHFSIATDWNALRGYFARADGPAGATLRLNPLGTALHLAFHGIRLYRIYDAVTLAFDLRRDPSLLPALRGILSEETIQPVGVLAVLALAARIAGLPSTSDAQTAAFVSWVAHREALPLYLRNRAQFTDAFFGNGGRIRGTCPTLAIPTHPWFDKSPRGRLRVATRTVARVLTGLAAGGYPKRLAR